MKIDPNRHKNAFYCHSSFGPIFGNDIIIGNNANTTMNSRSNLGFSYKHPQYAFGTEEAQTFLEKKLNQLNFNWMKLKFIKKDKFSKRMYYSL
jgi:hypothetical protein